jgi:hypothetical protein
MTLDFVDELTFIRKSVENVAGSKKRSCVEYLHFCWTSLRRKISAGHLGTERGTS